MKRFLTVAAVLYLIVSLALSCCVSFGLARWTIILHRAPFLVVDIACSTVATIRDDGKAEGTDQHGEYIALSPDALPGDHVLTVFVWHPLTVWRDDIIARFDVATWRR